jgi:hypothetical protein
MGNYGVMEISETVGGGTTFDIIKKYSDEFKPIKNIPEKDEKSRVL